MKKILLLFPVLFSFIFCHSQDMLTLRKSFHVMSFNIRLDNPADGPNAWSNRKTKVYSIIRLYKPDILGLQEPLPNQLNEIAAEFRNYAWYGVGREDGKDKGEFNPIFYNTNRFELMNSGTFWLSETPEVPGSKSWNALLPRICSWVKLKDRFTGDSLFAFNTHFDHGGDASRKESARLLQKKITEIAGLVPVVVTGDFNDDEKSDTYRILIDTNNPNRLINTMYNAKYPHHGGTFTYVGFDFIGIPGKIIDFIFVKDKVNVKFHAFLTDTWDGIYASDHIPVFSELELN